MTKSLDGIKQRHGKDQSPDPNIAAEIDSRQEKSRLTCAKAHAIAAALAISPADVGKTMDLTGIRINRCQLGLFGYYPEKKVVKPVDQVAEPLRTALEKEAKDNHVPCAICWALADQHSMSRMEVAAACETLGIKVAPCQLGAF
jgi:hypothetical protein